MLFAVCAMLHAHLRTCIPAYMPAIGRCATIILQAEREPHVFQTTRLCSLHLSLVAPGQALTTLTLTISGHICMLPVYLLTCLQLTAE
jgi:hypothetical protein